MAMILNHKITFAIMGVFGFWGSRRGWKKECVSTIVIIALLLAFLADTARSFLIHWTNRLSKFTLAVIEGRFELEPMAEAYARLTEAWPFTEQNVYFIFLIIMFLAYFLEYLLIRPNARWGPFSMPSRPKLRERIAGAILGGVNSYLITYFLMTRGVFPEPETHITFLSHLTREFVSAQLPLVILGFVGAIIVFGLLASSRG